MYTIQKQSQFGIVHSIAISFSHLGSRLDRFNVDLVGTKFEDAKRWAKQQYNKIKQYQKKSTKGTAIINLQAPIAETNHEMSNP